MNGLVGWQGMKLVAYASLLLLAFAGCLEASPSDPTEPQAEDKGPRRSVGSDGENSTSVPMEVIEFYQGPIRLVAGQPQSFDVDVPANLTAVEATLTGSVPAYQEQDLRLELSGCGAFTGGGISASVGGTTKQTYAVCGAATSGGQTFTATNGPAGYIEGTLKLVGKRPVGNATAAA